MYNAKQERDFSNYMNPEDRSLLDKAIAWIRGQLSPEDVFPERDLAEWATENGFVKEANAS